jgi:hypothetical protein
MITVKPCLCICDQQVALELIIMDRLKAQTRLDVVFGLFSRRESDMYRCAWGLLIALSSIFKYNPFHGSISIILEKK